MALCGIITMDSGHTGEKYNLLNCDVYQHVKENLPCLSN